MKLLKELNIKWNHQMTTETLDINKQEFNFVTYRQP